MKRLLALEASAGTGKTYALAMRYVGLLLSGADPKEVLAITFTNKAAHEMSERVGLFLSQKDPKRIQIWADWLKEEPKKIEQKLSYLHQRFLNADIFIMTIDSFVQRILRKFAYYAGVASDFEIGGHEGFELFLQSLDSKSFDDFVRFARWFDQKGLEDFFALLYEKDKELPPPPNPLPDNTQQLLAAYRRLAQFVQTHGTKAKQEEFDPERPLQEVLFTKSGNLRAWIKKSSLCETKGIKECKQADGLFLDFKKELGAYFRFKESYFLRKLFDFYGLYKKARLGRALELGRLDFTDIKHLTYDILRQGIDSHFLYFRLDSRLQHILIDEFQDTSTEDWRIFEPIVDEIAATNEWRSFFYVGDKKQAIYGFRGGNAKLFDYVKERYGMDEEELERNYRSRSHIVEYVNNQFGLRQKSAKEGGYVEVEQSEEPLKSLDKVLEKLQNIGIQPEQIAILVPTNQDIQKVAEHLDTLGLKAVTSSSKLMIHQPRAKALIDLISYLHQGKSPSLYRFHFESFLGKKVEEFPSIEGLKPVAAIKKLAKTFDFWDESVQLLLQEAIAYKDIEEFIQHISECELQMPSAKKGIEVLTIHKSKGLAFEYVIVLDTLGQDKDKSSRLLIKQQGITPDRFWLRQKDKEAVDEEYALALEEEQKNRVWELKNVAYVALTRAQEGLFVLKNPKSRRFGFLDEEVRGELQKIESKPVTPQEEGHFDLELRSYGLQEFVEEVEEEYEPNDYHAITLGNAYHQALEVGMEYVQSRYALFELDFEQIAKRVEEAKKLEESFGMDSFREIPFILDGHLGIIDHLFIGEEIVVIDYKSATPQDQRPYFKQVGFYKSAIKRLLGKEARGYLLYLDRMKLQEV